MRPRRALLLPQALLLLMLLLQRRTLTLAGADPAKSHTDFPYCRNPEKEKCVVCAEDFQLWQPCEVRAGASGSVVLPCAFRQSWGRMLEVQVLWRVGSFHSQVFVFNETSQGRPWVHANFSGRVSLVGDPWSGNASLLIRDLRQADSNAYFCRVAVWLEKHKWEVWQGINGTRLNVTAMGTEVPPPTLSPLGPALGASAVLLALVLLGLGLFLARRRGSCRRPPPGRSGQIVEKEEPCGGAEYEEGGTKGSKAPPPPPPEDPHLFYAALTLSEARREGEARPPPSETTYAAIRT
ncbi:paired immunoglobulin-like type 2 receptor alpha isoform X2 [Anolis carolinensis]|uniref:paired immunoglobulin-like type 2 receptor alpha isoform X2 n=1 Tax=Anolis carolinensis TaxID=28377 RepID=UPI002F2B67D8